MEFLYMDQLTISMKHNTLYRDVHTVLLLSSICFIRVGLIVSDWLLLTKVIVRRVYAGEATNHNIIKIINADTCLPMSAYGSEFWGNVHMYAAGDRNDCFQCMSSMVLHLIHTNPHLWNLVRQLPRSANRCKNSVLGNFQWKTLNIISQFRIEIFYAASNFIFGLCLLGSKVYSAECWYFIIFIIKFLYCAKSKQKILIAFIYSDLAHVGRRT